MSDPKRVLRQHAEAVRRLGVDFLPVQRGGIAPHATPRAAAPSEEPAPEPREKPGAFVEPKRPSASDPTITSAVYEPEPLPEPVDASDRRASAQLRLDAIRARYESDAPHEQFPTDHTKIVFGEGDPCARLMFVGEAPGAEEDRLGRPFVGRSGQLLEKMIVAMGLSRESVYIANVLKVRPPDNATPTLEEARVSSPYLYEQIRTIRPLAIVTLGRPAAQLLLETREAMGALRGRWHELAIPDRVLLEGLPPMPGGLGEPGVIPVMPTYHPAFLLRSYTPENRAKVWSDLQNVMEKLGLGR
ncbi:MAG: uracil-DNA glycosylase [Phycisphaerales bacterium]|nr:MAG: uracil-DNA glycosylase [Phycisphaerales bacterium]